MSRDINKEIEEEFGQKWQDEQREKMVRIQFPRTIQRIEERVRLEEHKRTLEEVNGWVLQQKQLLEMFNPMSEVVRAEWKGEMGVYKKILELISKLEL